MDLRLIYSYWFPLLEIAFSGNREEKTNIYIYAHIHEDDRLPFFTYQSLYLQFLVQEW